MRSLRPGVSSLELRVLDAFWAGKRPASAAGIRLAVPGELPLESIEGLVSILVEKGYLEMQPGPARVRRFAPTMPKIEVLEISALRWCDRLGLDQREIGDLGHALVEVAEKHQATRTAGRLV